MSKSGIEYSFIVPLKDSLNAVKEIMPLYALKSDKPLYPLLKTELIRDEQIRITFELPYLHGGKSLERLRKKYSISSYGEPNMNDMIYHHYISEHHPR
jgi:hypothetical protein